MLLKGGFACDSKLPTKACCSWAELFPGPDDKIALTWTRGLDAGMDVTDRGGTLRVELTRRGVATAVVAPEAVSIALDSLMSAVWTEV